MALVCPVSHFAADPQALAHPAQKDAAMTPALAL
jgi:hypothetical protein